ncbi:hypothetical protein M0R04_12975 [Candidatus Dojkabacteria bacterium]|jgi:hypothetical protein|nr:hypothetical protein [Candidatus Dojkabacteria bacterium]
MAYNITGRTKDPNTGLTTYGFGNNSGSINAFNRSLSSIYSPNSKPTTQQPSQPLSVALGMSKPYQVPQTTMTLGQSFPGSQGVGLQNNTPPTASVDLANISAQIESIKAQATQLQKEKADADKAVQTPTTPTEQPQQSTTEKMWASLMGKSGDIQNQVTTSQQNLLAQQNAIYEKWGLTPEKYNRINDITAQVTEYQKQMAAIDTREAQAVDLAQNRPGTDLAFASGETARIQRAYAIQKSGVAAQASVLASEAQALQGNWDNAFKSAQLYVDNATKAQQQTVSDLKWGFEQYKDVIQAMTTDEQKRINDQLDFQTAELTRQQNDYWKQVAADQKQQGIDIDYIQAMQSGAGSLDMQSNMDYYIDQVRSRNLDLSTPTLPSSTRQAIVSAMAEKGIAIPKPLTAKQMNAADDATSGLDAVQQLRAMADRGELPLLRTQILGEGFLGRLSGNSQFVNLKKEAADIKTRIRTGAALNDSEIEFYSTQVPVAGDTGEDIQKKLSQLEGFYLGMSGLPVTVEDNEGQQFTFEDLYSPQQRLGLKQAIAAGYKLDY